MRYLPVALSIGAIVLAASCAKKDAAEKRTDTAATAPDTSFAATPGVSNIVLTCGSDLGATVRVVPWRVESANNTLTWRLVGSNVGSVWLEPTDATRWPLESPPPVTVPAGANGASFPVSATADTGTYKYRVRGICVRSASVSDTVILDPDMIIRR